MTRKYDLVNCNRNVVAVPDPTEAAALERKREAALEALRAAGKYEPDRRVERITDKSHVLEKIESKQKVRLPENVVKIHGHSHR